MANVKKGLRSKPPQWWRHLKEWKRVFWKRNRQAERRECREERRAVVNPEGSRGFKSVPLLGHGVVGTTHSQAGREPPLPIQISTFGGTSPLEGVIWVLDRINSEIISVKPRRELKIVESNVVTANAYIYIAVRSDVCAIAI